MTYHEEGMLERQWEGFRAWDKMEELTHELRDEEEWYRREMTRNRPVYDPRKEV